jgi:predicted TIM-barrel fold metal-dependent hydrolase
MKHGFRIFDADLHTIEPDDLWLHRLERRFRPLAPRAPPRHPRAAGATRRHPHYLAAAAAGYDAATHLQAMDIEGADVAVLFGTRGRHVQMHDELDPVFAAALARAHNDWTHEFCACDPQRLKFAAQIAYHDVDLAVREVERAVGELGAVAVIGNPNPVRGRHIHDACFEPLWRTVEAAGVPVCFHPTGVWTLQDDIGRRFIGHPGARLIADAARNPVELMLALASLIAGGVLERHPGLACAFLEGGCGWLPWWLWRLDDTCEKFPEDLERPLAMRPSAYFMRQCYVSVDAGERYLAETIAAIGDRRIVLATDYPHCDSMFPETVDRLVARKDLSVETKRRLLWDNAAELYARALDPERRAAPLPA